MYQQNMRGVDRRDQHRLMEAGSKNMGHFKKRYKNLFLGIYDFNVLNEFSTWNKATNSNDGETRRRDRKNHY